MQHLSLHITRSNINLCRELLNFLLQVMCNHRGCGYEESRLTNEVIGLFGRENCSTVCINTIQTM